MIKILSRFAGIGFLLNLIFLNNVLATELSAGLNQKEVTDAVDTLVFPSSHRSWTAPAVPNPELGLDVGIETTFVSRNSLLDHGDGTAIVPRIVPLPRVWATWDLPAEFRVSASAAPGDIYDGIMAYGGGVQWVFWRDYDIATAGSLLTQYTYVDAFDDLTAHAFQMDAQISRDLILWQPYAGIGLAWANSQMRGDLLANNVNGRGVNNFALHFTLGGRIELLAKLGFQIDFYDSHFSASMLLAHSF